MKSKTLVKMANQIGQFFRSESDHETAVNGIANHINKFWSPRMRRDLHTHFQQHGDAGLDGLVRDAVARLGNPANDYNSRGE